MVYCTFLFPIYIPFIIEDVVVKGIKSPRPYIAKVVDSFLRQNFAKIGAKKKINNMIRIESKIPIIKAVT